MGSTVRYAVVRRKSCLLRKFPDGSDGYGDERGNTVHLRYSETRPDGTTPMFFTEEGNVPISQLIMGVNKIKDVMINCGILRKCWELGSQVSAADGTRFTGYAWPVGVPATPVCGEWGVGCHAVQWRLMFNYNWVLNDAGMLLCLQIKKKHEHSYSKQGYLVTFREE